MASEFERPRITEINVRMDCNGCVQKVKKALNGINGIDDLRIDVPQQKLVIIGRANPERILKAIKKVRKVASLCSQTELPPPDANHQPSETPPDDAAPPVPPPEGVAPGGEPGPEQHDEPPPPPQEPPRDNQPPPQQPQENPPAQGPPPESNQPHEPPDMPPQPQQTPQTPNFSDAEEVHVTYHNPHDTSRRYGHGYGYGYPPGYGNGYNEPWSSHPGSSFRNEQPRQRVYHEPLHEFGYNQRLRPIYHEDTSYHDTPNQPIYYEPPPPREVYHEPPPPQPRTRYHEPAPPRMVYQEAPPQVYATQSHNMYRPAPSVTQYHYARSPPRYMPHNRSAYYDVDSYQYSNTSSIFSDENPNACTIV